MLFSPASPKCFKTVTWSNSISACLCVAVLDSYKHTAINFPEWSEPDMESVLKCLVRKNTHSLPVVESKKYKQVQVFGTLPLLYCVYEYLFLLLHSYLSKHESVLSSALNL